MKKQYALLFIGLTFHLLSFGQDFWQTIYDPCLSSGTESMTVTPTGRVITSGCTPSRYTDNSGANNWQLITTACSDFTCFLYNGSSIYAGSSMGICKSIDNGANWTKVNPAFSKSITDLAINSTGKIIACTFSGPFSSIDNGITWDSIKTVYMSKVAINSSDQIFAVNYGGVYRSDDNGTSFTKVSGSLFNGTNINIVKVNINGDVIIGTEGKGIYKSTDKGLTWTSINMGLPGTGNWIKDFIFNSQGHIFVSISGYGMFRSVDNGVNWTDINSGLVKSGCSGVIWPTALGINSSGFLYAGTNGCGTFKSAKKTVGIDKIEVLPFILTQNSPNPFSNSTTIRYTVIKKEHLVLKVYSYLGEELATLVDGEKNIGEYDVIFNGAEYSNGIYFYQVSAGNESYTRKMIFIKD